MRAFSIWLAVFFLLILSGIPFVWWIGTIMAPPFWLPPAQQDWLLCLPYSIFENSYWESCLRSAHDAGVLEGLLISRKVAFFASAGIIAACFMMYVSHSSDQDRIIRGRLLHKGGEARKALLKAVSKVEATPSIEIYPNIRLPMPFETRHWLITGAVGAGKTVYLRWLINQFIIHRQRSLILDIKGDFVPDLFWINQDDKKVEATLLNPFDQRSVQWWLGYDLIDIETAREFAHKFLSESPSDPFWSKAAGNLMVAVICSLQAEFGTNWSWAELSERVQAPTKQIKKWAEQHYQPAVRILDSQETEAAQSVLVNFSTDFAAISDIAAYWHSEIEAEKISLRDWLSYKNRHQMLILAWDASREKASKSWAGAFIDLAGMYISSPLYQKIGRVNFVLDEFAQLPKMNGIVQALDIGRSKGIAVLIGAQSFAQLRSTYGQRAESFRSLIGNHVFAQVSSGRDAEDASRFLGNQYVQKKQVTVSKNPSQQTVSETWHEREIPLMTASEFGTELGPTKSGIWVVYAPLGLDVYLLKYPYFEIRPFRKAFVAAAPKKQIKEVSDAEELGGSRKPQKQNPFKHLVRGEYE